MQTNDRSLELAFCALMIKSPSAVVDDLMFRQVDPETFVSDPALAKIFAAEWKLFLDGMTINESNLTVLVTDKDLLAEVGKVAQADLDHGLILNRMVKWYQVRQIDAAMREYATWRRAGTDLGTFAENAQTIYAVAGAAVNAALPINRTGSYEDFFKNRQSPFSTGYPELDRVLSGGWRPGRMVVILGSKKSGKTSLQANFTARQVAAGRHALVIEREFSSDVYLHLVVAVLTGIQLERLDDEANLTAQERVVVRQALEICERYMHIATGIATVPAIKAWARAELLKLDFAPGTLLQIDHLSLLQDARGELLSGLGMMTAGQALHDMINSDPLRRDEDGNVPLPIVMTGQIDPAAGAKLNSKGRLGDADFVAYGGKSPGQWVDEGLVLGVDPHQTSHTLLQQLVSRWGRRTNFEPFALLYDADTRRIG